MSSPYRWGAQSCRPCPPSQGLPAAAPWGRREGQLVSGALGPERLRSRAVVTWSSLSRTSPFSCLCGPGSRVGEGPYAWGAGGVPSLSEGFPSERAVLGLQWK